jgi:ATP-binding cassette, subfamily C (CFTR/MRP), member 1
MNRTAICDDASFGPTVQGCRGDFDFTFAFEQYIFSIIPSAILLLAAPIRLAVISRLKAKVDGNGFRYLKLVCE